MPVQACQRNEKPGYRWGGAGYCYTYEPGNEASKNAAKSKAQKQGTAIKAQGGSRVLRLNGVSYRVVTSRKPLQSGSKKADILGFTTDREDLIMIDGTLKKDRQGEVLLHELIHNANDLLMEDTVRQLGKSLYGMLSDNGLLPANFVARAVDGMANPQEEKAALTRLQMQEDQQSDQGLVLVAGREMGEGIAARSNSPSASGGAGSDILAGGSSKTDSEGGTLVEESGSDNVEPNPAGGGGNGDLTALRNTLGALRSEVRILKEKNSSLTQRSTKLQELEDAEKTEVERLGDENASLQSKISGLQDANAEVTRRSAFLTAASEAGVHNAQSAYRMIDTGLLQVDDNGNVNGVDVALESLKTRDPYIFRSGGSMKNHSPGNAGATGDPPVAESLSPEQREVSSRLLDGTSFN